MPTPRTKITSSGISVVALTQMHDDRTVEGSWSHPDVPLLIFADNILPAPSATFHGGAVGSGMPVQLLFWGSWWLSPDGSARRTMIEARTQQMLASPYFSELSQYGINAPHWRGSLIVTKPSPPMAFNSSDDEKAVPDLIDDLIDDDVFPDPDDERIAFVVLMPAGFTQTVNANGAHTYDYDYEFPFDKDYYWVAWVRSFGDTPGEDPEDVIRTMSHELVELFSDPESDGWYAGGDSSSGELGDAAVSSGVKQTAWVNGAHVQGYWSNRHSATVIPIDRDYRARIRGVAHQEGDSVVEHGTFRPDPQDRRFCDLVPACCLPDRDFRYDVIGYDEVMKLYVETQRYRQPTCAWSIEGIPVSGSGNVTVNVFAQRFTGRKPVSGATDVTIAFVVNGNKIELRAVGAKMNFDVTVGCAVSDGSITGKVAVNVIAKPSVDVGFLGVELFLDPQYVELRKQCNKAVADMFGHVGHGGISHRPKPGEPVIIEPGVLNELPAYTRVTQFRAARNALLMARMAAAVMPLDIAQAYAMSLVADIPALADTLQNRSRIG
jgi:hypothetical protein